MGASGAQPNDLKGNRPKPRLTIQERRQQNAASPIITKERKPRWKPIDYQARDILQERASSSIEKLYNIISWTETPNATKTVAILLEKHNDPMYAKANIQAIEDIDPDVIFSEGMFNFNQTGLFPLKWKRDLDEVYNEVTEKGGNMMDYLIPKYCYDIPIVFVDDPDQRDRFEPIKMMFQIQFPECKTEEEMEQVIDPNFWDLMEKRTSAFTSQVLDWMNKLDKSNAVLIMGEGHCFWADRDFSLQPINYNIISVNKSSSSAIETPKWNELKDCFEALKMMDKWFKEWEGYFLYMERHPDGKQQCLEYATEIMQACKVCNYKPYRLILEDRMINALNTFCMRLRKKGKEDTYTKELFENVRAKRHECISEFWRMYGQVKFKKLKALFLGEVEFKGVGR